MHVTFIFKLPFLLFTLFEFRTVVVLNSLGVAPNVEKFVGKILSCSPMPERFWMHISEIFGVEGHEPWYVLGLFTDPPRVRGYHRFFLQQNLSSYM